MITFLTHNEIDKARWDLCIDNAANRLIYAYSWYLDVICPSWCALVLNDYEAVMPVPTVKKIFNMAYQPFFAQQLGIFANDYSRFRTSDFIEQIPSTYKYINICINDKNDIGKGDYNIIERDNHILFLHQSYNEVYKQFNDHCRRNLKKAVRENLLIEDCSYDEVVDFYIENKGAQTKAIGEIQYGVLKQVLQEVDKRNMLKCLKVISREGKVLTTAAFYFQKDRIIYQIGTANEEGREKRAMYFLFNDIIKRYCNTDLIFDFEGSDIKSIARFFTGFGALGIHYHRIIINKLPWPFSWIKK